MAEASDTIASEAVQTASHETLRARNAPDWVDLVRWRLGKMATPFDRATPDVPSLQMCGRGLPRVCLTRKRNVQWGGTENARH